jgi:hypothetical protein
MLRVLLRQKLARLGYHLRGGLRPEFEAVYQRIFDRDLDRLGIANEFYPLNSAANYSLMYLVVRLLQTFDFEQVVELGAGQTTFLIDALVKGQVFRGSITTLEHDDTWRCLVQERVTHELTMTPLLDKPYRGGYDLSKVSIPSKIDLLLTDGPPAFDGRYLSRHSALPLLEKLNDSNFVIVVDDAERQGELKLVEQIGHTLKEKRIPYRMGVVAAAKCQIVIATGRYESAAFF